MPSETAERGQDAAWATTPARDVRALAAQDGSVLVVPVGSLEQHGDHLPVATDTLLVEAVTRAGVAGADVPALFTPPVWTGVSPHHASIGGTVTLGTRTLLGLLEGIAGSALREGFDAVLLLNGHGGNIPTIGAATTEIGAAHPDVEVLGCTYFQLAADWIDAVRESEVGGMAHGGEFETSLMLHHHPDLVADERPATPLGEPYEWGTQDMFAFGALSVYRPFAAYSESGAIGRPDLATAAQGEVIDDRLGDELAAVLTAVHEANVS